MVNLLSTQVQSRTISLHAIPPLPSPPGDIHPELCNEVFVFVFSLLQSSLITCVYIPKYYTIWFYLFLMALFAQYILTIKCCLLNYFTSFQSLGCRQRALTRAVVFLLPRECSELHFPATSQWEGHQKWLFLRVMGP